MTGYKPVSKFIILFGFFLLLSACSKTITSKNKTESNQDIIDYLNSIEASNNQGINQLNNNIYNLNLTISELNDQITTSQNQIIALQNNNVLLDEAIAFIPPDQIKKLNKLKRVNK